MYVCLQFLFYFQTYKIKLSIKHWFSWIVYGYIWYFAESYKWLNVDAST